MFVNNYCLNSKYDWFKQHYKTKEYITTEKNAHIEHTENPTTSYQKSLSLIKN